MLMALDMYVFSIDTLTFDDLARRASYCHVTNSRIGARDAAQFIGVGEETIAIAGTVYTEIADNEVSVDELRRMAATGDVWSPVDGRGTVYGAFVIATVDDRRKAFWPDGTPRQIDFSLDLIRIDHDAT